MPAGSPRSEIGKRALGERAFLRDRLRGSAQALALRSARRHAGEGRKKPEIDVHGLERAWPGVDRLDVAARDVPEQRAMRRGRRRQRDVLAEPFGGRELSGKQTD